MLKNIQALRAVAAILVVIDHMNGLLDKSDPQTQTFITAFRFFGQSGVDLFFVISGFVMVTTCWNKFGTVNVSVIFMLRRLARIIPPYWIVLFPLVVIYIVAPKQLMHTHAGHVDIFASILLLPTAHARLLDISWTLTFELFFYSIFSIVLIGKRSRLVPLLGIWSVLQIIAMLIWTGTKNPYLGFLSVPLPIEFIMGALIGYRFRCGTMPHFTVCGIVGLFAFGGLFIGSATNVLGQDPTDWRILEFGLPAALIVYGAVGWEIRSGSISPAWLVKFGDASYSAYLWHSPIVIACGMLLFHLRVHGILLDSLTQVVTLALVVSLSVLAYNTLEKPLTLLLNRRIDWFGRRLKLRSADVTSQLPVKLVAEQHFAGEASK